MGYACVSSPGAPDVCSSVCGDARRVGAEGCDDGNEVSALTLTLAPSTNPSLHLNLNPNLT